MTRFGSGSRNGRVTIFGLLLALLVSGSWVSGAAGQDSATPAADPNTVSVIGDVRNPLTLTTEQLQQYPSESVEVTFELGGTQVTHTFTGTRMLGLIDAAELLAPRDTRYPLLQHYFVLTAKDGYQVVIAGGELDPQYGAIPYLLAWEIDGQPLSEGDAPAFFVAPYDYLDGRMVWGLTTIEVHSITETVPNA